MTEHAKPDAVVFDLDGTLVDTVETRIVAWLRTFAEEGIPADRGQVAKLIGSDGKRVVRVVAEAAGLSIDDERAEEIDRRSGELFSKLNTDPRPLPGATDLLRALDERAIPWAIATSSRREQVGVSINALNLTRQPTIVDGSQVANAKPAPDLLIAAARELHIDTSRCWYVGDAIWDMQASRAAGMPGVGVVSGSTTADELVGEGAEFTVGNLADLIPLLR